MKWRTVMPLASQTYPAKRDYRECPHNVVDTRWSPREVWHICLDCQSEVTQVHTRRRQTVFFQVSPPPVAVEWRIREKGGKVWHSHVTKFSWLLNRIRDLHIAYPKKIFYPEATKWEEVTDPQIL